MALSDKTQMSQMKKGKPSMSQKAPAQPDVCYGKEHKGKSLSDGSQMKQMRKK
jgi:hypothetical protein